MRAKKTVCFFSALLVLSALMNSANAVTDTTATSQGGGVTIGITYPKEAYPNTTITHYVTITSSTTVTLKNFTVVIKALVNSSWQEILNGMNVYGIPPELPQNYNLTLPLPQDASWMLQCFIFVNTSSINDLATTVYTTLVSNPTFSEIQSSYNELLANYTSLQQEYEVLQSDYDGLMSDYSNLFNDYTTLLSEYNQLVADHGTLLGDYNELSANYSSLYAAYTTLLSQHNQLTSNYNSKVSEYEALDDDYRVKINELGNLNGIYSDLNDTYYMLQADYGSLQIARSTLNQTYLTLKAAFDELEGRFIDSEAAVSADRVVLFIFVVAVAVLIAFIVYLKRKKEDPYLVIRKETVSVKSDKET
jgi:predicted nuclease with TOPRIM domain